MARLTAAGVRNSASRWQWTQQPACEPTAAAEARPSRSIRQHLAGRLECHQQSAAPYVGVRAYGRFKRIDADYTAKSAVSASWGSATFASSPTRYTNTAQLSFQSGSPLAVQSAGIRRHRPIHDHNDTQSRTGQRILVSVRLRQRIRPRGIGSRSLTFAFALALAISFAQPVAVPWRVHLTWDEQDAHPKTSTTIWLSLAAFKCVRIASSSRSGGTAISRVPYRSGRSLPTSAH